MRQGIVNNLVIIIYKICTLTISLTFIIICKKCEYYKNKVCVTFLNKIIYIALHEIKDESLLEKGLTANYINRIMILTEAS